ncbi:fungal-specific transcription factor domain-containing protein [Mycena amicta]|nr:fungal-specific transcription factor domain-containing protein [Mycena amicta]
MSSNEDENGTESHPVRNMKRRIARACDVCRRRKNRCDGSQVEGDTCSTCLELNLDCTYLEAAAKRTPARSTYIKSLESRLERSEAQVKQLRTELTAAHFSRSDSKMDMTTTSLHILRTALHSFISPPPPPSTEDLEHLAVVKQLEQLRLGSTSLSEVRFLGKSSGVALVKATMDLKADVNHRERRTASDGVESRALDGNDEEDDRDRMSAASASVLSGNVLAWTSRRPQYWTFKPWEHTTVRTHTYTFPPLTLMNELVDLYFAQVNMYLPLLHRPTFERGVRDGLFLRNDPFAATVLLVCAVASRWHADPRVGAPGGIGVGLDDRYGRGPVSYGEASAYPQSRSTSYSSPTPSDVSLGASPGLACGWAYFDQVPLVGKHMFGQATLYDLQCYCLAVQFLESSAAPQTSWNIIGIALRLAQDIGIHRRSAHIEEPSVERELFKRAFWVLVHKDRIVSSIMGRPCALQHDDFDIDLPIECDDEYWEHPTRPFQQPPGIPSRVTFFNTLMALNHILAFSLKILYSLGKVRDIFSVVNETWEHNVVTELDSALNTWRDRVPEHLRWDPSRADHDSMFFDQSVALQCGYHHLQILVHRPFIPMMRKSAPTALPSLAICTSAARSCANVADIQRRRKGDVPVVFNFYAVFTSGLVLLLNVWSGKRSGLVPNPTRDIANVQKCMDVVKVCEDRWQHAGLLWDLLAELASAGQMQMQIRLPDPDFAPSQPQRVPLTADSQWTALPNANNGYSSHPHPHPHGHSAYYHQPAGGSSAGAGPVTSGHGHGHGHGAFGQTSPLEPSVFARAETWNHPPPDPYAPMPMPIHAHPSQSQLGAESQSPSQAQFESESGDVPMNLIDPETIAMWANAPVGLQVDEWGNYFNNFSGLRRQTYME